MTETLPVPQLMTIGEVRRRLTEQGVGRSKTLIRRLEAQGVCTPIRPLGHDRRLYTVEDVAALAAAIRGRGESLDAA